jgi:hypothetical protein
MFWNADSPGDFTDGSELCVPGDLEIGQQVHVDLLG